MADVDKPPLTSISRVLVLGASGAAGSILLEQLLASPSFRYIRALSREPLGFTSPKLENQYFTKTLDEVDPAFFEVDAVFSCLGAYPHLSAQADEIAWVEYVLPEQVARMCQVAGAQQFLLLSCHQAQQGTKNARLRKKIDLQDTLQTMGFPQVHIFKPGILLSNRQEPRWREDLLRVWYTALGPMLSGKNRPLPLQSLAQYMIRASLKTWDNSFQIHSALKILKIEKKVFDFQNFEERTEFRELD